MNLFVLISLITKDRLNGYMKVIDLNSQYKNSYLLCLNEETEELKAAAAVKGKWYDEMAGKGLRVKLALDDMGEVGGLIQYLPIEYSWVIGHDLYFITCIWVKSYKAGGGSFQHQGMGKALLKAAEEDVKSLGAKGLVAWGTSLPVWMKASWYKKQGYEVADRKGFLGDVLVWKAFAEDADAPQWDKSIEKPEQVPGKLKVSCSGNGWCTAMNLSCIRAKNVAAEFGDQVLIDENHSFNEKVEMKKGVENSLFINGKKVSTGPPPSKEKLRRIMAKKVRKARP